MSEDKDSGRFWNRWSEQKRLAGQPRLDATNSDDVATEFIGERSELPVIVPTSETFSEEGTDVNQLDAGHASDVDDLPALTDADMPAIETLSSDSDLSAFFSKGVSAALRKAALRHVFQQPVYNVRDGLNDYDGDYTVFEPLGDTVTSDMKWHIARKEQDRLEQEALEKQELALRELEQKQVEEESSDAASLDDEESELLESEIPQDADVDAIEGDVSFADTDTDTDTVDVDVDVALMQPHEALNIVPVPVSGAVQRRHGKLLRVDEKQQIQADEQTGQRVLAEDAHPDNNKDPRE